MPVTYRTEPSTYPTDPTRAIEDGESYGESVVFARPQHAVDYARHWVRSYTGADLPRARVTAHVDGSWRTRLIFRAWRKVDGEYIEERISRARKDAK